MDLSSLPSVCQGRSCIKDPLPGEKLCQSCKEKQEAKARAMKDRYSFWEAVREERPKKGRAFVYAMGNPDEGLVKIGITLDIAQRHKAIRASSPIPIEVLGFVESDHRLEKAIHAGLAEHREHGEWFRRTPEVVEVVRMIREKRAMELEILFLDGWLQSRR